MRLGISGGSLGRTGDEARDIGDLWEGLGMRLGISGGSLGRTGDEARDIRGISGKDWG